MNVTGRDWPPDPQLPTSDKPTPTTRGIALVSLIIFLVLGSVLASWFVAALPGDQPWAPAIVPAGWTLALVAFLVGSFLNRDTK
ncbi:MAG: hypothetical protein ACRDTZ_01295 [Pseudonocardiaceae bacterium]